MRGGGGGGCWGVSLLEEGAIDRRMSILILGEGTQAGRQTDRQTETDTQRESSPPWMMKTQAHRVGEAVVEVATHRHRHTGVIVEENASAPGGKGAMREKRSSRWRYNASRCCFV